MQRFIQRSGRAWIGTMCRRTPTDLLELSGRKGEPVGPGLGLGGNAVPEVFDELKAFVETQVKKVGNLDRVHPQR